MIGVSFKNALRDGKGVDNAQTSISSMTLSRVRAWGRGFDFGQEGVLNFKRLMDSTVTESIDVCYLNSSIYFSVREHVCHPALHIVN